MFIGKGLYLSVDLFESKGEKQGKFFHYVQYSHLDLNLWQYLHTELKSRS